MEKKSCWTLRQWPKREALEFCYCSAETEWRGCGILLLKAVGGLCLKSNASGLQATIKTYREFVSVAT